jgi:bacillolysin
MRIQLVTALALLGAASCASTRAPGPTPEQTQAFTELENNTRDHWTWIQNDVQKAPKHLASARSGRIVLQRQEDASQTTLAFLTTHRQLFRMRDPMQELTVRRAEIDAIGMTHTRFQQVVRTVPVDGAELMTHYDAVGRITSIDSTYIPGLEGMDLGAAITPETALSTARAEAVRRSPEAANKLQADEPRLLVYAPPDRLARLAWRTSIHAIAGKTPAIWVTTVDAKTGAILHVRNNIQAVAGSGKGFLGDTKKLEVSGSGGSFTMEAAIGGVKVRTSSANYEEQESGEIVTSNRATSWDTGVAGAGAAVDAHAFATDVLRYYKEKHGRNALDGEGGALESVVHYGNQFANAFWVGTAMVYGDGDPSMNMGPLASALDVVAHEFSHGVTENTSALEYQGQSGALNEAFSDIIGSFVEHMVAPDDDKNWLCGEAIGDPIRDLKDPAKFEQPAHMDEFVRTTQDEGGVHINSGIINNAAFLMTMGGTNPSSKTKVAFGIGWEKSEKLWYRANTKYFGQSTDFGAAATGVMEAAKDLKFTENEQNIVDCAFKAVGLGDGECAEITKPLDTDGRTEPTSRDHEAGDDDGEGGDVEKDKDAKDDTKKPARRPTAAASGGCSAGTRATSDIGWSGLVLFALGGSGRARKVRRRTR